MVLLGTEQTKQRRITWNSPQALASLLPCILAITLPLNNVEQSLQNCYKA